MGSDIEPVRPAQPPAVPVKRIDHVSGKFLRYMELRSNAKELDRQIKRLEVELREEVGTAHEATIFGETVVTYRPVNRLRVKELATDNPTLYKEFVRPIVVDEFDTAAFQAAHPNLFEQYRSRSWLPKET